MDELRRRIEKELVVEREGWAVERIARVTKRLRAAAPDAPRLDTLVVWLDAQTAFTAGETIYIGRRLLERFADDDACAFVIAHELAHHVLGHIPNLGAAGAMLPVRILIALLGKLVASRRNERDADLLAIELCVDAGYEQENCLAALDHLEMVALDYGDIDGAVGDGRGRTHPSALVRKDVTRAHLAAMRGGHRLATELAERRRLRKQRLAIAAGSVAASVALFVLFRKRPRWL